MLFLHKSNIIITLLILLSLRSLFEINMAQSFIVIGLILFIAYEMWLQKQQVPDINGELQKELEAIKGQMSGLMIKNASKPSQLAQSTDAKPKRFF